MFSTGFRTGDGDSFELEIRVFPEPAPARISRVLGGCHCFKLFLVEAVQVLFVHVSSPGPVDFGMDQGGQIGHVCLFGSGDSKRIRRHVLIDGASSTYNGAIANLDGSNKGAV